MSPASSLPAAIVITFHLFAVAASSFTKNNNAIPFNHDFTSTLAFLQPAPIYVKSSYKQLVPRVFFQKHSLLARTGIMASSSSLEPNSQGPCLIFPGGGLFFYWQAGVIAYLQEEGYDFSSTSSTCLLSGASAGALAATLAATDVNPYDATELALSLAEEAGVWTRPLGLQGVWGSIIYEWLDTLLPEDAEKRVAETLHLLVTPVPSFGKTRVSHFDNRRDLINANMASVHLPWFLDGNLISNFRGKPHIDGSFLAKPSDYTSKQNPEQPTLILDFKRDPVMKDRASEFIKVISKQSIWDIFEQGKKHALIMDKNGEFDLLRR